MYKVMLIDDEPIIVEGLTRVLPWEEYGCKIVATASDGVEGSSLIRKEQPDLIFSDIAMPEMDGLTMIAGLKSEFPNMQISILTGYRDFEYAQKAIRLGVCRFLLKPSNLEEIKEALTVMCDRLKQNGVVPQEEGEEDKSKEAGSFIVKKALEYLEQNYVHKLTLTDVAEKTYVSQWHLSKLLNKYTGKNFSELLNHIRIEEAKKLLADPSLRIGEIAEQVGFIDFAHFSRVFKKQTGISANEYRNQI